MQSSKETHKKFSNNTHPMSHLKAGINGTVVPAIESRSMVPVLEALGEPAYRERIDRGA